MNFKEIYQNWYNHKKMFVKLSTASAYNMLGIKHLLPYFESHTDITSEHMQQFVFDKLNQGLKKKSIADMLIVLKMVLKFAYKHKKIGDIPDFKDVQFPISHDKKKTEVMQVEDFKRLIDFTKNNMTFENLGILIVVSTGMRIGEVCGLKFSDIDLSENLINVNRTVQRVYGAGEGNKKTGVLIGDPKTTNSNRQIPISSDLREIFEAIYKHAEGDFFNKIHLDNFVLSNCKKPKEPRNYRVYFKKQLELLGMKDLKFHGLRHSFATHCIAAGVDVKTLSSILGHSNVSTTLNLYVHPDNKEKAKAINKMLDFI